MIRSVAAVRWAISLKAVLRYTAQILKQQQQQLVLVVKSMREDYLIGIGKMKDFDETLRSWIFFQLHALLRPRMMKEWILLDGFNINSVLLRIFFCTHEIQASDGTTETTSILSLCICKWKKIDPPNANTRNLMATYWKNHFPINSMIVYNEAQQRIGTADHRELILFHFNWQIKSTFWLTLDRPSIVILLWTKAHVLPSLNWCAQ